MAIFQERECHKGWWVACLTAGQLFRREWTPILYYYLYTLSVYVLLRSWTQLAYLQSTHALSVFSLTGLLAGPSGPSWINSLQANKTSGTWRSRYSWYRKSTLIPVEHVDSTMHGRRYIFRFLPSTLLLVLSFSGSRNIFSSILPHRLRRSLFLSQASFSRRCSVYCSNPEALGRSTLSALPGYLIT